LVAMKERKTNRQSWLLTEGLYSGPFWTHHAPLGQSLGPGREPIPVDKSPSVQQPDRSRDTPFEEVRRATARGTKAGSALRHTSTEPSAVAAGQKLLGRI
jgi:hypothetical protein